MTRYQGPSGRVRGNPGSAQFKFSESQLGSIQRSVFNRSHGHKTTFNEGYLIPIFVDEVLPGDTFNMRMTAMCRMLSPLYNPIMDNMYLESFWFFCPSRILWNNWERFNGAQDDPADTTDYTVPQIVAPVGGIASGDLGDYFGLPIGIANLPSVNSLPFRMYNMVFREWFRDENLQNSPVVDLDDGPDTYTDYVLLRRGKRKDYFTSALPWTQKINDGTTVTIGLAGQAPVTGFGKLNQTFTESNVAVYESNGTHPTYTYAAYFNPALANEEFRVKGTAAAGGYPMVFADLSAASGISVNALRQAVQLQRLFERDARGGTRYVEILWSHFQVRSSDARLQRPELLGTGYSMVNVHPVPQTSGSGQTGQTTYQGNLAAFATSSVHGHGFRKSFEEHGYVMGIVCVRADLNYQQGVERMWSRSTRYDYFWPALAHIGEQAILNQEIYLSTNAGDNAAAFGYTGRYNEYRFKPSIVSGLIRSAAAGSLDSWHLAQQFGSLPTLGDAFIQENAPMDRITAVTTVPHFIIDAEFNYKCARPMSIDAIPGFMDHF